MGQVQIRNKKVRIAIKDGDKEIGMISFNPDDTQIYTKFVQLIEQLTTGSKSIDNIKFGESELDKKLETLEDFENASALFDKIKQASQLTVELWSSVCKGLDEIFGEGVCQCFTQGDIDPDLLVPLIDAVTPYFKKSRQSKVAKYKANQSDVME